jgi:hypothetical protein
MGVDTAWLVLTVLFAAGAAGSFARWLLSKTTEQSQSILRIYLIMGIVFLVLAVFTAAITLIR